MLLGLFALGGCAEAELASHVGKKVSGPSKSEGNFKVGNPYKVDGKWYKPEERYVHEESGIASWYGPQFHGKKTANGETFDMNELTAAHRTLQMPSLIRVTNLDNGRSLIMRVNDRGPFSRGRVLDVSKRGAELLGFIGNGTAKVKIQVLEQESKVVAAAARRGESTAGYEVAMNEQMRRPEIVQAAAVQPVEVADIIPPPSVTGHNKGGRFYPDHVVKQMPVHATTIYVQAGSFTDRGNADRLAAKLESVGRAVVMPAEVNGRQFYRVRIAASTVSNADTLLASVVKQGADKAIIVVD